MNEQRIRRELRRLAAREVTHTDLWPGVRVRLARRHELRRPGTGFARPAGSDERGGPAIDSEYTWSERDRPRGGAARWAALAAGAGSLVLLAVLLAGAFGGHKALAPEATRVPGSFAIGSTPAATPASTPTPTVAATVVPQVLTPPYATPATCPVTPFVTSTPFGNYYTSTWLGYGALFAGLDRAYGGHWYAGGLKVMWMRLQGGALSITGTRLDGPAPPLKADIPDGYGAAGIQVSEIDFPVAGCWSVTGSIGSAPEQQVHFVVYAYPTGCRESAWASDPATPQPCAPPQSTATPNLPESSIATRLSARIIPVNAQPISGYVYADLESPGTLHLSGTYDDAGLHLLWLPVQGTCASHDLNQAFGERFYGTSTTPGSSEESFDVRLPTAGKQPPYALLTFIDGGGPLVACADLNFGASAAATPAPASVPASCPVTQPPATPFVPPAPYPAQPGAGQFWYGSSSLWAVLPASGVLDVVPQDSGAYVSRLLYFHQDYDWQTEPQPPLKVSGHRLDAPAMTLDAIIGSGFSAELHSSMIANLRFPAPGCWQVDADHLGSKLTVVVWVPSPANTPNQVPETVLPLLLLGLWRVPRGGSVAHDEERT